MSVALSHYETLTILNADLSDDALKGIITSASAIIEEGKGTIHKLDEWGRRRLAYPIQKRNDGFYFLMTYTSAVDPRREMERRFKLNEDVMRTQTVVIDEAAVEVVKESIIKEAAAKEEAAAREAAAKVEAEPKEAQAKETVKEDTAKEEAAVKEASELVEEAAKAAPAPDAKEEVEDPSIKAASDLVEAAAKSAKAPAAKSSTEEEGGSDA